MKRKLIVLIVLLMGLLEVSAQQLSEVNISRRVSVEADSMRAILGLNAGQAGQVRTAQQKYYEQLLSLPSSLTPDQRSAQINQLTAARDAAWKQAMTAAQWTVHLAAIEQRRQKALQAIQARRNKRQGN